MARIAGVNIPQNKLVRIGLTYIFGIGEKNSNEICKSLKSKIKVKAMPKICVIFIKNEIILFYKLS